MDQRRVERTREQSSAAWAGQASEAPTCAGILGLPHAGRTPLFYHVLKRSLLLLPFLFTTLAIGSSPDLRLVGSRGGTQYEIVEFRQGVVIVKTPSGENKILELNEIELAGEATPSLDIGYSPAIYQIEGGEPDYHRAQAGGELQLYQVTMVGSLEHKRFARAWNDLELTKLWPKKALKDPEARLVTAWWNEGWTSIQVHQLYGGSLSSRREVRQEDLPGRPVLLLWRRGQLLAPEAYRAATAGTPFASLQAGRLPPPGEDPAAVDPFGLTWWHYAAAWGLDLPNKEAPDLPARIRGASEWAPSPLHLAVSGGHRRAVGQLLKLGFDAQEPFAELGFDAGHFAILAGHFEIFKDLLDRGYPTDERTDDGIYKPITLAIDLGADDITGLLLERGAELPRVSKSRREKLLLRDAPLGRANALKIWIELEASLSERSGDWNALTLAAHSGNAAAVKVLLEAGMKPNDPGPIQPLMLATIQGNLESARLLLAAGANPNFRSADGSTPLRNAILAQNAELVSLLLQQGADPNPPSKESLGLTELATFTAQDRVVSDLFEAGAVCEMKPELAEEILTRAIANDIVEMTILAYERCVGPDFALYDAFPLGWVADYYKAGKVSAWWKEQSAADAVAAPEITGWRELDEAPRIVAPPAIDFDEDDYARYGRLQTRMHFIVDEDGSVKFPRFSQPLPPAILLKTLAALAVFRFTPPLKDGKPARTEAVMPLDFDRPPEDLDVREMAELSTRPRPTFQGAPYYPEVLKRNRISGTVRLEFVINSKGRTERIRVLSTTHPLFGPPAIEAIKGWRFEPGKHNGKPCAAWTRVTIPFTVQ